MIATVHVSMQCTDWRMGAYKELKKKIGATLQEVNSDHKRLMHKIAYEQEQLALGVRMIIGMKVQALKSSLVIP